MYIEVKSLNTTRVIQNVTHQQSIDMNLIRWGPDVLAYSTFRSTKVLCNILMTVTSIKQLEFLFANPKIVYLLDITSSMYWLKVNFESKGSVAFYLQHCKNRFDDEVSDHQHKEGGERPRSIMSLINEVRRRGIKREPWETSQGTKKSTDLRPKISTNWIQPV